MKPALISCLILLLSAPASAALYDLERIGLLYDQERRGIGAYQSGKFEKAFELLSDTATKGFKESQYLIATMIMKGEGVNKSILTGLAWLGVAKESGNEEWIEIFDKFYEVLNDQQRAMLDEQISRYAEKYGGTAQGVTCTRRKSAGSRRMALRCDKAPGAYTDYDIEPIP